MAAESRPFTVLVTGPGLEAGTLAGLLPAPIGVAARHPDPDCVVVACPDGARVRALRAAWPRALLLAVSPLASAGAVFAAGAAACVGDADPRLVAAQIRALWRRFGAGQPQPREGAAARCGAEPDVAAGLPDGPCHDRQAQP